VKIAGRGLSPEVTTAVRTSSAGIFPCEVGSAPGWPLVLYFHHTHRAIDHYTNLRPEIFAKGLDVVLDRFEAVALPDIVSMDGGFNLPDRPTVLMTFDDGYADVLQGALPALTQRSVPAVFFVSTQLVGCHSDDPRHDYVTWSDCAELVSRGHVVAAHGRTHRPLVDVSEPERIAETWTAIDEVGARFPGSVPCYAYPFGVMASIPHVDRPDVDRLTAFSTVKAAPAPWDGSRRAIRRTYLPTGNEERWPGLVDGWLADWEGRS
jgi:peptidoglycan/xylan/chitin deacetylase (PgdA/CDA1 family)